MSPPLPPLKGRGVRQRRKPPLPSGERGFGGERARGVGRSPDHPTFRGARRQLSRADGASGDDGAVRRVLQHFDETETAALKSARRCQNWDQATGHRKRGVVGGSNVVPKPRRRAGFLSGGVERNVTKSSRARGNDETVPRAPCPQKPYSLFCIPGLRCRDRSTPISTRKHLKNTSLSKCSMTSLLYMRCAHMEPFSYPSLPSLPSPSSLPMRRKRRVFHFCFGAYANPHEVSSEGFYASLVHPENQGEQQVTV